MIVYSLLNQINKTNNLKVPSTWKVILRIRVKILLHRVVNHRRLQKIGKKCRITLQKEKAHPKIVSEIIAGGLLQNLPKDLQKEGLQNSHLCHVDEVDIQIIEVIYFKKCKLI